MHQRIDHNYKLHICRQIQRSNVPSFFVSIEQQPLKSWPCPYRAMENRVGIEPTHRKLKASCLTTWPSVHSCTCSCLGSSWIARRSDSSFQNANHATQTAATSTNFISFLCHHTFYKRENVHRHSGDSCNQRNRLLRIQGNQCPRLHHPQRRRDLPKSAPLFWKSVPELNWPTQGCSLLRNRSANAS